MSSRPDLEVESKRDFLAHINLGFKSEYEFENGSDCFEFISKELGVNEIEGYEEPGNIENKHLLSKNNLKVRNCKSNDNDINHVEHSNLIKKHLKEKKFKGDVGTNKNVKGKNISIFKGDIDKVETTTVKKVVAEQKCIKDDEDISTLKQETDKNILESITTAINFNNIEIIYDPEESEKESLNELEGSAKTLEKHIVYECYVCKQSFSNKARRRQHLTFHFRNQTKLTTCPFCGKSFTSKSELSQHFTTHLTKNLDEKTNKRCNICLKIFSRSTNLTRHIKSVHNTEKENILFKFNCESCPKVFSKQEYLQRHMLSHGGKRDYKCNICQKSFLRGYHLNRHLKLHTGDKQYKCTVCFKEFTTNFTLQNHCIKQHEEISKNRYNCHICKKSFFFPNLLRHHMNNKHHGQKDFKCKICSKLISTDFFLKNHESKHDLAQTKKLQLQCQECRKYFGTKYHLQRHMVVHTGLRNFECPVCLKDFTTKYQMKRHLRVHTSPKKYNCMLCFKTFYTLNNYRRHCTEHKKL